MHCSIKDRYEKYVCLIRCSINHCVRSCIMQIVFVLYYTQEKWYPPPPPFIYIILLIINMDYFSIPLYHLMLRGTHYCDFKGASLRHESPTIRQFNQPNFLTNNKENTKLLLVCCDGIHWWPIDCLRKGPVMFNLFRSHDFYLTSLNTDGRHANHATHISVRWRKHLIVWCVPQNQPHCQKRHGSNAELVCVKIVRVVFKCTICPY